MDVQNYRTRVFNLQNELSDIETQRQSLVQRQRALKVAGSDPIQLVRLLKKDDPEFKGSREEIATLASLLGWDQLYKIDDLYIPGLANSALTFHPQTFLPPIDLGGRFIKGKGKKVG